MMLHTKCLGFMPCRFRHEDLFCVFYLFYEYKNKMAKIRNQYNQVSHLTRGTIWESDKTQNIQKCAVLTTGLKLKELLGYVAY